MNASRWRILSLTCLAAAPACGSDGPEGPTAPTTTVATLAITPAQATITLDSTQSFRIEARDADDVIVTLAGRQIAVSVSGGTSLAILSDSSTNADGSFTAVLQATAAGTPTTVTVTVDGVSGTATITVVTSSQPAIRGSILLDDAPITGGVGAVEIYEADGEPGVDEPLAISGIDTDGAYRFTGATPNTTYGIFVQPPLAYAIDPSEMQTVIPVTTDASGSVTRDVSVVEVWFYDDFNHPDYTDDQSFSSNFPAYSDASGSFSHNVDGVRIEYDPDAGPGGTGDGAMVYHFPARAGLQSFTLRARVDFGRPFPVIDAGGTYWSRILTRESDGFKNGDPAVTNGAESYKFGAQLQGIVANAGFDQMGLFINGSQRMSFDLNMGDVLLQSTPGNGRFYNLDSDPLDIFAGPPAAAGSGEWAGEWNSWVLKGGPELASATQTESLVLWINGVKAVTMDGATGEGSSEGFTAINFGANINSGPPTAQDRWWREVAAGPGRLSTLGGVADVTLPVPAAIP